MRIVVALLFLANWASAGAPPLDSTVSILLTSPTAKEGYHQVEVVSDGEKIFVSDKPAVEALTIDNFKQIGPRMLDLNFTAASGKIFKDFSSKNKSHTFAFALHGQVFVVFFLYDSTDVVRMQLATEKERQTLDEFLIREGVKIDR